MQLYRPPEDSIKRLQNLVEVGLKANKEKSLFGYTETDYLGLWDIKDRVRPLTYKV